MILVAEEAASRACASRGPETAFEEVESDFSQPDSGALAIVPNGRPVFIPDLKENQLLVPSHRQIDSSGNQEEHGSHGKD